MMHIPRWTIPVWVLVAEFVILSVFPLSDSYADIKSNPMGILTSYLIFDGWGNIFILVLSTLTFLLAIAFVGAYWRGRLAVTYLVATNLSGVIAGLVYYESVYSFQTGGGMSAATFGALASSLGLGVVALANSYSVFHKDVYLQNIRFYALLVFIIFGVYLISDAFTGFVGKPGSPVDSRIGDPRRLSCGDHSHSSDYLASEALGAPLREFGQMNGPTTNRI